MNPIAQLDSAHVGDIRGGLGTIREHDTGPRRSGWARIKTLAAILGPGLIVMVGDNDAGAFGTYTQTGQNYGTSLLWTLLLLVPVLYVNQEMVLRLGAVTGVGHARLILDRFGKFWGAFSVIDLFILNALTIVTEFIGLTLAFDYLGVPKISGIAASAVVIMAAASTGDFRRFERFALLLESIGRLAAALAFGSAIGFERQLHQKMAGLRTNVLVALGSRDPVVLGHGRYLRRRRLLDAETYYTVTLTCKRHEEAHLRSVLLHALAQAGLGLRQVDSADIPDTSKVRVTAQAVAPKRNDAALEQIVGRLSLEPHISAAAWQVDRAIPEA